MRADEKDRDERKERATNLEKSLKIMRMCTQYIRENNKNWKDEEQRGERNKKNWREKR